MTTEEMLRLKEPIAPVDLPGLADIRVVSGKPTEFSDVLRGAVLLAPAWSAKRREWGSDLPKGWVWREIGKATPLDAECWPCWDGITQGLPVTLGHLEALRAGGWLAR